MLTDIGLEIGNKEGLQAGGFGLLWAGSLQKGVQGCKDGRPVWARVVGSLFRHRMLVTDAVEMGEAA